MRKWIFALAVLFVASIANAENVRIAAKHRLANREGGFCVWCSLETLARHHNIRSLIGLVDNKFQNSGYWQVSYVQNGPYWQKKREWIRLGIATQQDAINELNRLQIGYRIQWNDNFNTKILYDACEERLGAVISFKPSGSSKIGHAVVLVGINDKEVEYIDSNHPREISRMSRAEFNRKWTGGAIVLDMMPDVDDRDEVGVAVKR